MEYFLVTAGMVVFIVLVLVLLARGYPGSGADLLDWKPQRDYETEVELEQDDIAQMLKAQNEYRRKRGASELTELDAERMAQEDNRVRSRGRPLDEESLNELDRELRERDD
jgi:apolipoprotein N-acyltransferase